MRPVTLWGVYHANGGLVGELTYVIGKLRGTAHCGLCDITHGSVRVKPGWKTCEASFDGSVECFGERLGEAIEAAGTSTAM